MLHFTPGYVTANPDHGVNCNILLLVFETKPFSVCVAEITATPFNSRHVSLVSLHFECTILKGLQAIDRNVKNVTTIPSLSYLPPNVIILK